MEQVGLCSLAHRHRPIHLISCDHPLVCVARHGATSLENTMSKKRHGNKEAKKQKKAAPAVNLAVASTTAPSVPSGARPWQAKK
jgi:hypothetical protein